VLCYTGAHHLDGGVVDHADDSDGHADTLSVQMEEHKEANE